MNPKASKLHDILKSFTFFKITVDFPQIWDTSCAAAAATQTKPCVFTDRLKEESCASPVQVVFSPKLNRASPKEKKIFRTKYITGIHLADVKYCIIV